MHRAHDGGRETRRGGCAEFDKQSREVAVDVRHGPDLAQVCQQTVLVHRAAPEKHASIASMHARVGASW